METLAPDKFSGYKATISSDKGASPCFVVNERENMKFNDGTTGPAKKVKVGSKRLVGGWSGGGGRYETFYSHEAIWVKASRIN